MPIYRDQYGRFARQQLIEMKEAQAGARRWVKVPAKTLPPELVAAAPAPKPEPAALLAPAPEKDTKGAWCDPKHQYRFMGQDPDKVIAPMLSVLQAFNGRGEQTYCQWRQLAFTYRVNVKGYGLRFAKAFLSQAETFWAMCGGGMLAGCHTNGGAVNGGWYGGGEGAEYYPLLNDLVGGKDLSSSQIRDCIGRSLVHAIMARGLANQRFGYGYFDKVKASVGLDYLNRGVGDVQQRGYFIPNVAIATVGEHVTRAPEIGYRGMIYGEQETLARTIKMEAGPEFKNFNSGNTLRLNQLYITEGRRGMSPDDKQAAFRNTPTIREMPDCVTAYWGKREYWENFPKSPLQYQNNLNF